MRSREFIIIAVNNYSCDKRQKWHLLMAKLSEVPVDPQKLEEVEERRDALGHLDLGQISAQSGM